MIPGIAGLASLLVSRFAFDMEGSVVWLVLLEVVFALFWSAGFWTALGLATVAGAIDWVRERQSLRHRSRGVGLRRVWLARDPDWAAESWRPQWTLAIERMGLVDRLGTHGRLRVNAEQGEPFVGSNWNSVWPCEGLVGSTDLDVAAVMEAMSLSDASGKSSRVFGCGEFVFSVARRMRLSGACLALPEPNATLSRLVQMWIFAAVARGGLNMIVSGITIVLTLVLAVNWRLAAFSLVALGVGAAGVVNGLSLAMVLRGIALANLVICCGLGFCSRRQSIFVWRDTVEEIRT